MRKHVATLFVAIIAALAAVMTMLWIKSEQQTASLETTLAEAVEQQLTYNERFLREMQWDIKDEIENHGKIDNKGLLDTLPIVRQTTLRLIEDSIDNTAALTHWRKTLMDWGQAIIHNPDYIFSLPMNAPEASPSQVAYHLARWEALFYELQNERLGFTGSGSPVVRIETHSPNPELVFAGDTLKIDVFYSISSDIAITPRVRPSELQTSLGYVVPHPVEPRHRQQLIIPTEDLLTDDETEKELAVYLTGKIDMATGGYIEITDTVAIRVIRR